MLQMLIIAIVLALVVIASYLQSEANFRASEGRKLLAVAESLGSSPLVRLGVTADNAQGSLAPVAEGARSFSGASSVVIADANGKILTSPIPAKVGRSLDFDESDVRQGRAWVGVVSDEYGELVAAHVPVFDVNQKIIGIVEVGSNYPTWVQSLARSAPNLLTYVGVASLVGVVGSVLLSRRIKRQTLGLEPRDITELVQHREAMLHGIKEGVVGLDSTSRVSLVNDEARRLLDLPEEIVGKTLPELGLGAELEDILTGRKHGMDLSVVHRDKILVLNRMPIKSDGRDVGSVTTLRDRTELMSVQQELDVTRSTASALRAQAHEFTNRLHTISGLVQLGQTAKVVSYITSVSKAQLKLQDTIAEQIKAPALAALLMAKVSLASEQRVELRITKNTRLGPVDDELEADLVAVVGNLVDNALDALRPQRQGWIAVELTTDGDQVHLVVADSGKGVDPAAMNRMFEQGYTTKTEAVDEHGFGLSLVRLICTRRGGSIEVANNEGDENGAIFSARLPLTKVGA
jgi:sensor histidine kinase regulating citrate/malate metabolism